MRAAQRQPAAAKQLSGVELAAVAAGLATNHQPRQGPPAAAGGGAVQGAGTVAGACVPT